MTTKPAEQLEAFREIAADAKPPDKPQPFPDVDAENYIVRAKAFFSLNGGRAFIIAQRPAQSKYGDRFKPTLMEWGAWRAWFVKKGLPVHFMDSRDFFQVPAQWPCEFDASADEVTDRYNGSKFFDADVERRQRAERNAASKAALGGHLKPRPLPKGGELKTKLDMLD